MSDVARHSPHSQSPTFGVLARHVVVRNVFTQFAATKHRDPVRIYRELLELDGVAIRPVLVHGDDRYQGVLFPHPGLDADELEDAKDSELFDEHEFFNYHLVSADLPLLEALSHELLPFRVVLDGTTLAGVLTADDLLKPAARVCLLALTLDLEQAALELCSHFPHQCLAALSESRRKMAEERASERHARIFKCDPNDPDALDKVVRRIGKHLKHHSEEQMLLDATMLIDKGTMVAKCNLTIDASRTNLRKTFKRAEDLRNACAHPQLVQSFDSILGSRALPELVNDILALTENFRLVTPKRRGTRRRA